MSEPHTTTQQAIPSHRVATDTDDFVARHIGPNADEIHRMLAALNVKSMQQFIEQTIPSSIRYVPPMLLPVAATESAVLASLQKIAEKNQPNRCFIGTGYYGTIMPRPIQRNVLENPGWLTSYTPYQAEVAQGRLEALLTFQQIVIDLTGLAVANASLLDEATAAAEAMCMALRLCNKTTRFFFVDEGVFPQTSAVLRTHASLLGIDLVFGSVDEIGQYDVFGALLQYPDEKGEVRDLTEPIRTAQAQQALAIVACDPLALVLLRSPGDMGADIAIGSMQRFGLPMSFGGPHAAFLATRAEYRRDIPGRIVGVARDRHGKRALRTALQTREQHVRREKANSNICTAQALSACLAAFYAVWHGAEGLRQIAWRIHRLTMVLTETLKRSGITVITQRFFGTVHINVGPRAGMVYNNALAAGYNVRLVKTSGEIGVSLSETTDHNDVITLLRLICGDHLTASRIVALNIPLEKGDSPLVSLFRRDEILTHPVFHEHRSEQAFIRYLKRLQNRDLALDHSMIPLGSCTMKLSAASIMMPLTWPAFTCVHPFTPLDQVIGYREMINDLELWLTTLTGFDKISLQPNSGAQGEYAGLSAIRAYQRSRGETQRDVCLIPRSAHGTNPASAMRCGLKVINVACDENGAIDFEDLRAKAQQHSVRLSCLMITYPSTCGIFEENVQEICDLIHHYGGQVYLDGANLNALIGLSAPGFIGADAGHLNLHKTFAMPHGGGGPGVGPVGVRSHLAPFLPGHFVLPANDTVGFYGGNGAVASAPWGSAGLLPVSWMYISLMGLSGLTQASQVAILSANYMLAKLSQHYPPFYSNTVQRVAHECILDIRPIKAVSGVTELDIAKRLMDYGFHAPTVSFPVSGTLMIEPTESEPLAELDRFIAAMISIREEIRLIESGVWPHDDNPLKNAPHTLDDMLGDWQYPYTRAVAVTPLPWVAANKFWPFVNRIDEVYGDRNFCCTLE